MTRCNLGKIQVGDLLVKSSVVSGTEFWLVCDIIGAGPKTKYEFTTCTFSLLRIVNSTWIKKWQVDQLNFDILEIQVFRDGKEITNVRARGSKK